MNIVDQIEAFTPTCEQEQREKPQILAFIRQNADAFSRTNETAHMTASAWVLSPDGKKAVMCYHNLYHSWSWCGGHADGEDDLLAVAIREVKEETGLAAHPLQEGICSLEILPVHGHVKHGKWVSSHLHMNVTYLLQAEGDGLRVKQDENSAVAWMTPEDALEKSSEPWMVERVYRKLVRAAQPYMK